MLNAGGDRHSWTAAQVKAAVAGLGLKLSAGSTCGDLAYLANMFYADLYPKALESEAACLKAAVASANDPDGYEGQTFCRWKTDLKHKGENIDFTEFI